MVVVVAWQIFTCGFCPRTIGRMNEEQCRERDVCFEMSDKVVDKFVVEM